MLFKGEVHTRHEWSWLGTPTYIWWCPIGHSAKKSTVLGISYETLHTVCDKVCELMFKIQRKIVKNRLLHFPMDTFFVKVLKPGQGLLKNTRFVPSFETLTKNLSMVKSESRFLTIFLCILNINSHTLSHTVCNVSHEITRTVLFLVEWSMEPHHI